MSNIIEDCPGIPLGLRGENVNSRARVFGLRGQPEEIRFGLA